MSLSHIHQHYLRILRLWPKDALRGLTFQAVLQTRMTNRFLPPALAPHKTVESNEAQVVPVAIQPNEPRERAELNAMYTLLENRYSKQYPCSDRLLRPAFNPAYYEDLADEMAEAPGRSWVKRKWLRWSKLVRFA